jgi:hypothetical protein
MVRVRVGVRRPLHSTYRRAGERRLLREAASLVLRRALVFSTGRVRAAQPGLCGVHSAFSRLQRRGGSGLTRQPTGLVGAVLARGCSRTRSKLKVASPSEAVGAHGEVAQEGRVRHAGGERTSGSHALGALPQAKVRRDISSGVELRWVGAG